MLKLLKIYKKENYWKDMFLYEDDVTGFKECFHRFDVDNTRSITKKERAGRITDYSSDFYKRGGEKA